MKTALVCGAGGFIGHHLVKKLKEEGYWVRGADIKLPEFSKSAADEFLLADLRKNDECKRVLSLNGANRVVFDEVYQLAADMGGMGFIHAAECEILLNSSLINIYMTTEAVRAGVQRYFFSSSACVYRDMTADEPFISEEDAYPALPDNEYGWEKLFAERVALAFGRRHSTQIRIARFQNCYGPEGTWCGGREKAPAALCRKIAEVEDGGTIEVWGDGSAHRSYTYVSDICDGIFMLMQSDIREPVNIGSEEFVTVNQLVEKIAQVSGKKFKISHVDGPVGVHARNHRFEKIKSLGWSAKVSLKEGIWKLYPWICEQVQNARLKNKNDFDTHYFDPSAVLPQH